MTKQVESSDASDAAAELARIVACSAGDLREPVADLASMQWKVPDGARSAHLLRILTNSGTAFSEWIAEGILLDAEMSLNEWELHQTEDFSSLEEAEASREEWLRGWFTDHQHPRLYRFPALATLLNVSSRSDRLGGWSMEPVSGDVSTLSRLIRISEFPSCEPTNRREPEAASLPVAWMDFEVTAHFQFEAYEQVDRLHEQVIGWLIVHGLATTTVTPPMIEEMLRPWPGGAANANPIDGWRAHYFPSSGMRSRALRTTYLRVPPLIDTRRRNQYTERLNWVFGINGSDARTLRAALANFARARFEADPGESFLRLCMSLEGALLEPSHDESATARISEAVAHHLGGGLESRRKHRKLVNDLYAARSLYVHTGLVDADGLKRKKVKRPVAELRADGLDLVRSVLERAIGSLAPDEATSEG